MSLVTSFWKDTQSEKVKYLISRCTGQSQEHLRNQRDLNRQAGKDFAYEDAKEALKGPYFTEDPKKESHRLVVLEGIKQGTFSVKQYIQYSCGHMSRLDSKDEDKRAWLLRGLNDQDFKGICMVTYGLEGDKASVLSLSQHILALDSLAVSSRKKPVGSSGHGASVQGKGKGKVAGLGIQGGIQKSKPKPKPAHAEDLSFRARQALMKEGKCFACKQKGHNQANAGLCPMHPRHADAVAGRLSAMQVDPKN